MKQAKFSIGQCIHHRLFDYRGVVVDVDPEFLGQDDWYEANARSRPPKDEPWYHVLVHNAVHTTYVAEQNLEPAEDPQQIVHPLIEALFTGFDGTGYTPRQRAN